MINAFDCMLTKVIVFMIYYSVRFSKQMHFDNYKELCIDKKTPCKGLLLLFN